MGEGKKEPTHASRTAQEVDGTWMLAGAGRGMVLTALLPCLPVVCLPILGW